MHTHEYALLAVVAIPFLAIVGLNVYLWWGGERGTLLVPSALKLPKVLEGLEPIAEPVQAEVEAAPAATPAAAVVAAAAPANDVHVREAA